MVQHSSLSKYTIDAERNWIKATHFWHQLNSEFGSCAFSVEEEVSIGE